MSFSFYKLDHSILEILATTADYFNHTEKSIIFLLKQVLLEINFITLAFQQYFICPDPLNGLGDIAKTRSSTSSVKLVRDQ